MVAKAKRRKNGALHFQSRAKAQAALTRLRLRGMRGLTLGTDLTRTGTGKPAHQVFGPFTPAQLEAALTAENPKRRRQPAKKSAAGSRKKKSRPAKKRPAAKKNAKRGRKNPGEIEAAAQMYEDFHGEPPKRIRQVTTEEKHPTAVADCGKLLKLEVLLDDGRRIKHLDAEGDTRVWTTPEGGQLYFNGGIQRIDLDELGLGDTLPKDHVHIGEVVKIWYHTSKGFHDFEPIDYHHKFRSSKRPHLNYDTRNKRIYFSGGKYQVRPEGIVE